MVVEGLPQRGLVLVSGASRSGKSAWAEYLASQWQGPVRYLATGPAAEGDQAWSERVGAHQRRRPAQWQTLEVGAALEESLQGVSPASSDEPAACLLIDSLGTWLAWHLEESDAQWQRRCDGLLAALTSQPGPVLLVIEETGWGVVPPTAIGGLFRDRLGALQQRLMGVAAAAWLVVAGRALNLMELGLAVPSP